MVKSATVVWLALVAAILPAKTLARDRVEGASETKATFLIIPHTHWEGSRRALIRARSGALIFKSRSVCETKTRTGQVLSDEPQCDTRLV